MNLDFFESTLGYNWDMTPVDRSFDPVKVNEYLSLLHEPDRSFVRELLDKTLYVRYNLFKEALVSSYKKFENAIGRDEFYILLPTNKVGSEHWIVAILWPALRHLNVKGIVNKDSDMVINDVTNVVIFDDAIYSGQHTMGTIDELTFNLPNSRLLKFHLIIPYVTVSGVKSIYSMGIKMQLYAQSKLPNLSDLMDIGKYYSDAYLYKFGIEIPNLPPIYFDHKVAGPFSTYSPIYLEGKIPGDGNYGSLFKSNPSREKIEELAELFRQWMLDY